MSLHAHPLEPIPELTSQIAHASFPKCGRAAEAPWRLALVTVLQALENLSDRQAAEMVRGRLDWKYGLSLPLDDEGFDASILVDFRERLVEHGAQVRFLQLAEIAAVHLETRAQEERHRQALHAVVEVDLIVGVTYHWKC